MTPRIIVDATAEPVTYDDIVEHSKLVFGQQQSLIESYIRTARESVENTISATISPKTLEIALHCFSFCIPLPLGPVQTIVSVKYIDVDGAEQEVDPATYYLSWYERTHALRLVWGAAWPTYRRQFDGVKIRYTAGYRFNDSPTVRVPEPILQAIRLLVDHMNDNRTGVDVNTLAELPYGIKCMLDPYRLELGV